MDSCCSVEREVDKVLSKFGSINDHAGRTLLDLIECIRRLQEEFEAAPEGHELSAEQLAVVRVAMAKAKETVSRLATDHRDLHSTVSKVGKAIDRNFVPDFGATSREEAFADPDKLALINKVVCHHYYRQGMRDVAEQLAKEADIMDTDNGSAVGSEPFTELNRIVDALKTHDLGPALHWASEHRSGLERQGSSLEFQLHRLQFIEMLRPNTGVPEADRQAEAIEYARKNFTPFVNKHEKEIQTLMGMLLFAHNGLTASPYAAIVDSSVVWMDVHESFIRDACHLLGVPIHSPLAACVNAGCTAVPALLNIKQVMLQRQVATIWNGKDELPIEIDLGSDARFHSVFACPILKQQATETNPPMRLLCGHVISKDALSKLCSGNKMKCPYCPIEQSPSDARLIYF